MYSFVVKIAIDAKRAVELDIITPTLGFNIANVLDLIVQADPIKTSVIFENTFLFKLLYFLSE